MASETMDITVVTSVTGARDPLRDDHVTSGAKFIAFVDRKYETAVWTQKPACAVFTSARRNSRIHKLLIHHYVDSPYSIWIDAIIMLKAPAATVIRDVLGDADLALFAHETRSCTYDEAEVCSSRGLDNASVIGTQIERYRKAGLPRNAGLGRCSVLIRRHSPRMEAFNNCWWSEYCRHSSRDQIAFMYAVRKSGIKVRFITQSVFDHPHFGIASRLAGIEPPESK